MSMYYCSLSVEAHIYQRLTLYITILIILSSCVIPHISCFKLSLPHTHYDFTYQSGNFVIYFFSVRIYPSGFAVLSINLKLLHLPQFLFASISLIYYLKYCKSAVHSCGVRWHAVADERLTWLLPIQSLLQTSTTHVGLAYLINKQETKKSDKPRYEHEFRDSS